MNEHDIVGTTVTDPVFQDHLDCSQQQNSEFCDKIEYVLLVKFSYTPYSGNCEVL